MSTRAIIGYKREDGKFVAGWQWNDGMKLAPLLRRHFDTVEKVGELIKNGVWNNIVSPKNKDLLHHFETWAKRPNSDYYLVPVGKCHLLKEKPNDTAEFCFGGDEGVEVEDGKIVFDSIEKAMSQDINYVYEFVVEENRWKVHR